MPSSLLAVYLLMYNKLHDSKGSMLFCDFPINAANNLLLFSIWYENNAVSGFSPLQSLNTFLYPHLIRIYGGERERKA
jgi:hypothetical protein